MKHVVVVILLLSSGCSKEPASLEAQSQSTPAPTKYVDWRNISEHDGPAVASAKSLCARIRQPMAAQSDPQPPPGGLDNFTRCMLDHANERIGLPEFEELCSAIPGSRLDAKTHQCFVISY